MSFVSGKLVRLQPLEPEDLPEIQQLNDDPVVRGQVVGWSWPRSMSHQETWYHSQSGDGTHRWAVRDSDDRMVGMTGLWDVDLHNRNALTALKLGGHDLVRGRGLGTDAIKLVMAFAFYDVGLERLYSSILGSNSASKRAYVEKCGWQVEGIARRHVWRHGGLQDVLHVGVLREEFDRLDEAEDYVRLVTGAS